MMRERSTWIKILDQLWLRNIKISNYYRRAMEAVIDPALKKVFLRLASTKAQLAFELKQQVKKLNGILTSNEQGKAFSSTALSIHLPKDSSDFIIKKCVDTENDCLEVYSSALSAVNEGFIREVLIRHRAMIQIALRELKHLQVRTGLSEPDRNFKSN